MKSRRGYVSCPLISSRTPGPRPERPASHAISARTRQRYNRAGGAPMAEITPIQLNKLIADIMDSTLPGKVYHDKYPVARQQSGPSCGVYSLKWAIDYRALKTGAKGALIPARARDVCANCGAEIRGLGGDIFNVPAKAVRENESEKKSYYCKTCESLPDKRKLVQTMRSLAKANKLSVMGELMEPGSLLGLAQLSGFSGQASLVDAKTKHKTYETCLIETLESGKMALLIYDINPQTGGPGMNGGTKAHWCVLFGYYKKSVVTHVLAVHGWASYYDWDLALLVKSVEQMKVHPGWDLHAPLASSVGQNKDFAKDSKPRQTDPFKRDGSRVIPAVDASKNKLVDVPGMDYSKVSSQFIEFG
jgi:hypothetical protein